MIFNSITKKVLEFKSNYKLNVSSGSGLQSVKSTQNHRMFHSLKQYKQNLMFQAKPKPMVGKFGSEVIMASSTVHFLTKSFRSKRRISFISFQEVKDPMYDPMSSAI